MVEVSPDLLRLLALPVFAGVAVMDVRTRRVPSVVWLPLALLGGLLLVWELLEQRAIGGFGWRLYLIRVTLSVGLVIPLAFLFGRLGAFGGADAKALAVIAVLFPTYPRYEVGATILPMLETDIGVFSVTILTNAVLLGLTYPLALGAYNATRGRMHRAMFVGRPVHWSTLADRHGRLLESTDGFTRNGLDLDALRMYLTWRGCELEDLRADPATYQDHDSIPTKPNSPGDGRITDGGRPVSDDPPDPWGARSFLADADGAYGTRPETLRDGLALLVECERVWYSPGIPFLVPLSLGLLVALVYGDLLFHILQPVLF